ncbi:50S ribosomal protein L24, chloroplastic-like [Hordeum vulgare subsp. vulgare]|uniref:50S ribosomal protein L24, chloroplastic-like n=1 Tax=Hordeum vulgare subsp. vulgare TaxID=112509 RepID=UPI001D1A4333|nr:50S ribosomal protein L24, chloroplastic-like [Hordeum vulgare subsp. vulgare]
MQVVTVKSSTSPLQLKRWERKKCKPNSLTMLHKMHVRVGDTVQVIAGREKGKVGEVVRLYKHNSTVIVKDLNLNSKHKKGTEDEPGEIVMIEGPIHSSNMMLYSKEKNVTSRVGHKILEDGTKVRYLKRVMLYDLLSFI